MGGNVYWPSNRRRKEERNPQRELTILSSEGRTQGGEGLKHVSKQFTQRLREMKIPFPHRGILVGVLGRILD